MISHSSGVNIYLSLIQFLPYLQLFLFFFFKGWLLRSRWTTATGTPGWNRFSGSFPIRTQGVRSKLHWLSWSFCRTWIKSPDLVWFIGSFSAMNHGILVGWLHVLEWKIIILPFLSNCIQSVMVTGERLGPWELHNMVQQYSCPCCLTWEIWRHIICQHGSDIQYISKCSGGPESNPEGY